MSRPDEDDGGLIEEVVIAEIWYEALGALYPDVFVRRECAFCHRERSVRDDNHAPYCAYWVFFGPRGDR